MIFIDPFDLTNFLTNFFDEFFHSKITSKPGTLFLNTDDTAGMPMSSLF